MGHSDQDQVRAGVKVEPPSLLARAAVFTVKSLVWGGCLYGAYNTRQIILSNTHSHLKFIKLYVYSLEIKST